MAILGSFLKHHPKHLMIEIIELIPALGWRGLVARDVEASTALSFPYAFILGHETEFSVAER